jgi:adenosylcobinamide-phosphate synthase
LYVFYSIIAVKDLIKHCRPVYNALSDGNLESARIAVGMIVGRDTNNLDEKGVARATIETLAENFVDGFLSPVFWYGAGCLIGRYINIDPGYTGILFMLFFKVVSTLDSMVGYKTTELKEIGWSGARLDDLMNFIPARLSLLFLAGGAVLSGLNPIGGIKTSIRDRLKHESPNSAHPESFVAGAIKARLGGPAIYSEGIRDKPWLGEEYPDPSFKNIKHVIRLVSRSSCLTILAFLLILIIGG